MLKTLVFTALLVLLATAACASMSLEDYAEECGEWRDDYGDIGSSSVSGLEDALEDWNALSPPSEVKGLHDLTAEGIRITLDLAKEGEVLEDQMDDLRDELDDARRRQRDDFRDEMDELSDEQEDLFDDLRDRMDDLPRRVERELEREDCI